MLEWIDISLEMISVHLENCTYLKIGQKMKTHVFNVTMVTMRELQIELLHFAIERILFYDGMDRYQLGDDFCSLRKLHIFENRPKNENACFNVTMVTMRELQIELL